MEGLSGEESPAGNSHVTWPACFAAAGLVSECSGKCSLHVLCHCIVQECNRQRLEEKGRQLEELEIARDAFTAAMDHSIFKEGWRDAVRAQRVPSSLVLQDVLKCMKSGSAPKWPSLEGVSRRWLQLLQAVCVSSPEVC